MRYQFNGFSATKPIARIIDAGKSIYDVFFYAQPDKGSKKQMRYKAGINDQPEEKRAAQAKAMAAVYWDALNEGWNPFIDRYPDFSPKAPQSPILTFNDGLDYALRVKRPMLSKYSMYDYDGCARFMKAAAAKTGHLYMKVEEIKRKDVRAIVMLAREMNNWTSQARNKYLTILRSMFSVLEQDDLIDMNPAFRIKDEPVPVTLGYKRLTDVEKERIADHLLQIAPEFFEYLMFIYDDGIRRKETLLLQVQDIRMGTREIRIRAEVSKNNRERLVPITDTLLQVLIGRRIWDYPPDYYIFSSNKFRVGRSQYHPNVPTTWWRELVQKQLGIDCKMYSLKHKGADDKILAGVNLDALRNLYGHRSQQMTEVYARAIKGKYKDEIIDKAPVFAKIVEISKAAK